MVFYVLKFIIWINIHWERSWYCQKFPGTLFSKIHLVQPWIQHRNNSIYDDDIRFDCVCGVDQLHQLPQVHQRDPKDNPDIYADDQGCEFSIVYYDGNRTCIGKFIYCHWFVFRCTARLASHKWVGPHNWFELERVLVGIDGYFHTSYDC